jgi:hypothetical protein
MKICQKNTAHHFDKQYSTPLPALRTTFPCGDGFKRAALA